ncbi:MAG: rhodanese-like domain-containing protein [Trueperaceae bacterium]|nr:MAG: rhodanese-like domain-containing protein [Trueperaceae bacterium]
MGTCATIDSYALARRMAAAAPPLVVAVTSPTEHRRVRIPGSRLLGDPTAFARDVPRDRTIVVSCRSPGDLTASWACRLLVEHGYRDVSIHVGGLRAWMNAGLPVVRDQ